MKRIPTLIITIFCGWQAFGQVEQSDILQYEMTTPWTGEVSADNLWNVYPRPQMKRTEWANLNGLWEYAIRDTSQGQPQQFDGPILVPFAVESALSRVRKTVGEERYLWYRKIIEVPGATDELKHLLHFGAVDWEAVVFINGKKIGVHRGGYTPFTLDISPYLQDGEQELVVRVWDPSDKGSQARGKQVSNPRGIWYTPVTGIWQTVWLESVPIDHFSQLKVTPDIDARKVSLDIQTSSLSTGLVVVARVLDNGKEVGRSQQPAGAHSSNTKMEIGLPEIRLWTPDDPFLYDLSLELTDGAGRVIDRVESYAGMRKVSLGKDANGYTRIMLNDEPLFQFGLLDQGWWPDGLYTPPSFEAMIFDVDKTKELGFNMLRKHVKVEPASYYHYCDRIGMLVWQDMPNGNYFRGLRIQAWDREDVKRPLASALQFERELKEMIDHFYSFPSILVWVPFNEGWGQHDTKRIARWTKQYDPSRLCDAPSGWTDRGVGEMIDVHIYPGPGMELPEASRASVIGEFGGLGLPVRDHLWWDKRNWGYLTFDNEERLRSEFADLIRNLVPLKSWGLSAAIYTQTTDVEGEVNGLITYDRRKIKLDPASTRTLLAPLYLPSWNKRIHLPDSEHGAASWKVSYDHTGLDWTQPVYDDFDWTANCGPFSSYDNFFLPETYSTWDPAKVLCARQSFRLAEVPERISLKYFLPKAAVEIFVNGVKVIDLEDKGGRKRHYTHLVIPNAGSFLQKGDNLVAVKVRSLEKECSFDLGLYSTSLVKAANPVQTVTNGSN